MVQTFPNRILAFSRITSLCLVTMLMAAGPRAVRADDTAKPEPAGLVQLQTAVTNLGYAATLADDKQSFSITWNGGGYNFKIHFNLARDGSLGYAYIDLGDFTPEQLAKLNTTKLLEESDIGNFYFSMEKGSNGVQTLYGNAIIPLSGITQPQLRGILQGISDKLDDTSQTWDTSLWK